MTFQQIRNLELSHEQLSNIKKIIRDGYFFTVIFAFFFFLGFWCIYWIFTKELIESFSDLIFGILLICWIGLGLTYQKVKKCLTTLESILRGNLK